MTTTVDQPLPFGPELAHVAVSVSDLDRSVAWYSALFGTAPLVVADTPAFRWAAWRRFGLHQHHARDASAVFVVSGPGLDHVSFRCRDRGALDTHRIRLDALGIMHGDVLDEPFGSGLAFWDPDGIALEFFCPATV